MTQAQPADGSASARKTAILKNCIITGGSGFLGSALAHGLLAKGCNVRVLDVAPIDYSHENLEYFKCDLSAFDDMEKHFAGIDTVFHAAAIIDLRGGSATAPEARQRCHSVNVEGGRNVLKACSRHGVARLVATSSNNATFNRTPNPDMDSSTPYATDIYDLYTETKVIIEPEILNYSGTDGVLTGVIRPAGIYGPGPNYMFVQLIEKMEQGLLVSNMGTPQAVHDVSFIDNLVDAHIRLAENLVEGSPCCGKPYFIVDDEKMNNFEFFRPIIESLGYKFPKVWIPSWLVRNVFVFWQWLHWKFNFPRPMLTPKELDKICVTHFSNTRDAFEDFGWRPTGSYEDYMAVCIPWCQQEMDRLKQNKKDQATSREAAYQVTLDMPIEKAWEIMQDLTVPDKYVPGVTRCEMRTDTLKGVGTSRHVWKKMYGAFPVELDETVVEWHEGTGFKLHLHNGDKDRAPLPKSYFVYKLEPAGDDKTLFTGTMGYTFWGGKAGALIDIPFVYPGVKMEIRNVVAAIKHFYETGTTPQTADLKRLRPETRFVS